jgi:uncharacterized membrane protein
MKGSGGVMTDTSNDRLATFGRACFAIALIVFGIQTVVYDAFVTRALPAWPARIPAQSIAAYVAGALLIAGGAAILFQVRARQAAIVLATMFALSIVLLDLPLVVADVPLGGTWTNLGKGVALFGGVLALTGWSTSLGRWCLAAFMVLGGIQHFRWTAFVATLVPAWMPGHVFWTYFAGVALIAGGVGLVVPATTRLAALASGVMLLLWVVMLHVPRALADLHNSNETTSVFEALAFAGLALVLAAKPVDGGRVSS